MFVHEAAEVFMATWSNGLVVFFVLFPSPGLLWSIVCFSVVCDHSTSSWKTLLPLWLIQKQIWISYSSVATCAACWATIHYLATVCFVLPKNKTKNMHLMAQFLCGISWVFGVLFNYLYVCYKIEKYTFFTLFYLYNTVKCMAFASKNYSVVLNYNFKNGQRTFQKSAETSHMILFYMNFDV